jgi:tetratricopeptide (TPR) repeat protein
MQRTHLLQLLEAALAADVTEYAARIITRTLADWPGDLELGFMLARTQAATGDKAAARRTLRALLAADPEHARAQRLLGALTGFSDPQAEIAAFACAHVMDGAGMPAPLRLPDWATLARPAYIAVQTGDWETARRESTAALGANPDSPLTALVHLSALWGAGQLDLARPLAEGLAQRWPEVIAFKLCLAECLFATGENARAIELLHDAAAQDITGQVAARHWGEKNPYRALWQSADDIRLELPGPLPARLIETLGLNRLNGATAGKQSTADSGPFSDDEIAAIQKELELLAEQLGVKPAARAAAHPETRDAYVLLSSRGALTGKYGAEGFAVVDNAIHALAEAQARMPAHIVYVDDADSLRPYGLEPAEAGNAWAIKHLIAQLVEKLKDSGEALGALVLIGGPDIIPFHHLPNPTEDPDADIPSDNPYASSDDNYFVPEWPVGRIPSAAGDDPAPLVRALKLAARQHLRHKGTAQRKWLGGWLGRLWQFLLRRPAARQADSFGYSANIWRQTSAAVFEVIGSRRNLQTCPPVDAEQLPSKGLAPARLSYFNLHGVEDGPEWYGQRHYDDPLSLPEYPVALRPADVQNHGRAPVIVFSEACYGANVFNKHVDEALCLRFLDSGTRAMVGSTKIAYGSVTEPLIAADLLGRYFWQNVHAGLPVGESLRLAKLHMANEMNSRQGFLDGEDQKTLISFVLYGDPLATMAADNGAAREAKRRALRFTASAGDLRTVATTPVEAALTNEAVAQIKSLVAQYLPGMGDAEVLAARARTLPAGANAKRAGRRNTIVTLGKTIHAQSRKHPHFARVTFDEAGRIFKLSVSR